ncbi:hypothetical protein JCM11641_004275 [Rhodosporidiobolus odoratus]
MPSALASTLLSQPDQLKASLQAHNASFDQLLKHIPAKYYIRADSDDEDDKPVPFEKLTKAQKKALAKAKKDEAVRAAKNEAKREARLAAYDPDEPKTIAEIQAARLSAAAKGKKRAADASSGEEVEDSWEDEEDSPNESDFADSDDEDVAEGDFLELDDEGVLRNKPASATGPAPTITELREKLQRRIADIQAKKQGVKAGSAKGKGKKTEESDEEDDEVEAEVKSKDDLLEERRRRAALRDNRRQKRKEQKKLEKSDGAKKRATEPSNGRKGGGKVNAAQQDDARPSKRVKADSPSYDDAAALVPFDATAAQSAARSDPSSIAFSNLDFTSNSQNAAEAGLTPKSLQKLQKASGTLKKNRHALPKDANQALDILAKRKQRMDELDPEKREKAEEKERWEKINLKAEGEKVRDDEQRLKKMAKRQEREKRKSAKAWSDRKATVEKTVSDRVNKRNANLAARSKDKKDKKMGVKKKGSAGAGKKTTSTSSGKARSKGRPGFEGGRKK